MVVEALPVANERPVVVASHLPAASVSEVVGLPDDRAAQRIEPNME